MTNPPELDHSAVKKKEKKTDLYHTAENLLARFLNVNLSKTSDRNAYLLVVEMLWATFLGAATSFNAAYALRLGSTDAEVNLLTSIPALLAILISIPSGRILQRTAHRKNLIVGSLALHRAGYLLIAIVPWLKFLGASHSTVVVITLILFTVPAQFFNIGFTSIQAEVISEDQRAAVFSMRNQIFHAVRAVCVFLLGLWLDAVIFPLNYQLMFLVTFFITLISTYLVMKIEIPQRDVSQLPANTPVRKSLKTRLQDTAADLRTNPQFLRFTINTFAMDVGLWAIVPLFNIYYINELGATDGWLGTSSALMSLATIFGFTVGKKVMKKWGRKKTLQLVSLLRPIFPLVVGLTGDLTVIIIISTVVGILMPAMDISHYSLLLTITPPDKRDEYTAIYSTVLNISAFASPFIGIAISRYIGIANTILIFAGVRLLGGLMWTIFPIREFDQKAVLES